jgi:hypothetical protein
MKRVFLPASEFYYLPVLPMGNKLVVMRDGLLLLPGMVLVLTEYRQLNKACQFALITI